MFFRFLILFAFFTSFSSAHENNSTIILAQNNETQISLSLNAAPILTAQTHIFKRQLYSSLQVLDLGQLALLKHNIVNQISKYKALRIFNVHGTFLSRKDLSAEYFFSSRNLNFPTCKQLCLSKDAHMVSSLVHLKDLKSFIPRNKMPFWVNTHQVAQSSSKYLAKYNIFFNGIDIQRNYANINATCPNYFFLNENRLLQKINPSNLAPLLKYFDTLENKYWVKSFPELQVTFDIQGNISVFYPPRFGSIDHPDFLANCICARSLRNNFFKLQRAQTIVRDAQILLSNLPLQLESNRIDEYQKNINNISLLSILEDKHSRVSSIINPSGIIHPDHLKPIAINPHNSSALYDIDHLQQLVQYLSLLDDIPLNVSNLNFDGSPSPIKFHDPTNITVQNRNKRLSLQLLKSIPLQNIFSKLLKIGSPYVYKHFKPFQTMEKLFSSYHNLRKYQKTLKMYVSNNLSDPEVLNLEKKDNIYNLTLKEKFKSINTIATPGLYQATELYRASFLLDYTYRRLMTNIPTQIFQNLKKSLNFNIHKVKAKIQQKGSVLLLHFVFEADVPYRKIENFHFRALPHGRQNEKIIQYKVPGNFSPALSPLNMDFDLCVKGIIHHNVENIQLNCPVETLPSHDYITPLYSYIDREYLLIKGPSHIKAKCLNNPSKFLQLHSDFAIISIGGGCHIEVSHNNLKGQFISGPHLRHFAYFEIIHQYNLPRIWGNHDLASIGLTSCLIVICLAISFGLFIFLGGVYFHSNFKFKLSRSHENVDNLNDLQMPPKLAATSDQ